MDAGLKAVNRRRFSRSLLVVLPAWCPLLDGNRLSSVPDWPRGVSPRKPVLHARASLRTAAAAARIANGWAVTGCKVVQGCRGVTYAIARRLVIERCRTVAEARPARKRRCALTRVNACPGPRQRAIRKTGKLSSPRRDLDQRCRSDRARSTDREIERRAGDNRRTFAPSGGRGLGPR